jgi:TfoX/Sxy family transcriptional regulator of competence genes
MAWKKNSGEMVRFLDGAARDFGCQRRRMFGCPVYFVNGNMFVGLHEDNIFLRLSESDRQELAFLWDEAAPFEPLAGRPMREYVVMPEPLCSDSSALRDWLHRGYSYVSSLPAKG